MKKNILFFVCFLIVSNLSGWTIYKGNIYPEIWNWRAFDLYINDEYTVNPLCAGNYKSINIKLWEYGMSPTESILLYNDDGLLQNYIIKELLDDGNYEIKTNMVYIYDENNIIIDVINNGEDIFHPVFNYKNQIIELKTTYVIFGSLRENNFSFIYDDEGNLILLKVKDYSNHEYIFENGLLKVIKDHVSAKINSGLKITSEYMYDRNNKLIEIKHYGYPESINDLNDIKESDLYIYYKYYKDGNLIKDSSSTYTYDFDKLGRLTEYKQISDIATFNNKFVFNYTGSSRNFTSYMYFNDGTQRRFYEVLIEEK